MIKLNKPHFWEYSTLLTLLLLPFSLLYQLIVVIRHILLKPKAVDIPVICVGNVVVGGTGKTPLVIEIVKFLQSRNKKVAIISRGYLGKLSNNNVAIKVSEDMKVNQVGDEALMHAKTAPTYINSNRFLAAKRAKEDGTEVIVMDDGLQNYDLQKNLSILVIDSLYGFGNGLALPAGPLREPLPLAFAKSDCIVITGGEQIDVFTDKPIFTAELKITNQSQITKNSYIALCSIANPNKFLNTLAQLNVRIKEQFIFEDHHEYSASELNTIFSLAEKLDIKVISTTKDLVKIPNQYHSLLVIVEISYSLPDAFYKLVMDKI